MSQVDTLQGPGIPPSKQPLASPPPPPPPRRSRAVACAECRRLKLKCDRAFPCMNCRRREVANLCPHGSLITRSRVPHSTIAEAAGRKHDVKWMIERIRRLEEALALVQSKVSDDPHPLLSASARLDGYGSASSEQPDSETVTPPPTTPLKSFLKPTSHNTDYSTSDDKPRAQTHSTNP